MEDELQNLWTVERPRVTEEVFEAALLGDRSENGGYIYGKKRLREIDGRIRWLSQRLDNCTVVRELPEDQSRVRFGAWIHVENEDGKESVYRLVGPDEFDIKRGFISIESPIGRALMGKQVDDDIIVKRPKGDMELTILDVAYKPIQI